MKKLIMFVCLMLFTLTIGTERTFSHSHLASVTVNMMNSDGKAIGTALLTQQGNDVVIHIEADNLPPGKHGLHFHTVAKCEAPSFTTAGAHFNPQDKQHGFKNPKGFHAGDLLNIEVGADGKVKADMISKTVTLVKGKPNSLLKPEGTSLIIHEKEDDYVTDPSGNSGNRIACGTIS
ncbi:superoxide dismutase [Paenibacillus baekrokdamisoli]|uniref:Superoxide dismutase [Cu-Zn] n=1 Tax=Paenibacillus baekrokdamisoli TaxID=1712516 RepID=A0A3G9J8Z8_9BACL|nr:superoxide dismutase family protein [Paenibacillus baekrokdamisoli]MBB3073351.1 Cu-Zn family superoxide dismutase [Paenibacillus baekrokdamisoli]BBH22301.1 superoxide dismutase [Paenibacillus baekrokdamisoli]